MFNIIQTLSPALLLIISKMNICEPFFFFLIMFSIINTKVFMFPGGSRAFRIHPCVFSSSSQRATGIALRITHDNSSRLSDSFPRTSVYRHGTRLLSPQPTNLTGGGFYAETHPPLWRHLRSVTRSRAPDDMRDARLVTSSKTYCWTEGRKSCNNQ